MVVGIPHWVVQHSVAQKEAELVGEPLPGNALNQTLYTLLLDAKSIIQNIKHKCSPVTNERCVHSNEPFIATNIRKMSVILLKNF